MISSNTMNRYDSMEIDEKLNTINEEVEELTQFFKTYTIEKLHNKKMEAYNASMLCHIKKAENPTKYKIIQIFNKLQADNIIQMSEELLKLNIQTTDEINTLMQRIYLGLQNSNPVFKKNTGLFCYQCRNFTFKIAHDFDKNTEVIFGTFLLNKAKEKYNVAIDINNVDYNLNTGKQTMVLVSSLHNCELLNNNILNKIFTDYINLLNNTEISPKNLENLLLQLCVLLEFIENKTEIENIKNFVLNYLQTNKNNIGIQTRLTCENALTIAHKTNI